MASTRQLSNLFAALGDGDLSRARTIAETITDNAEERGHGGAARTLRSALRRPGQTLLRPAVSGPASLPDALTALLPVPLASLELPHAARQALDDLIREHRHREALASFGLEPRSRVLLHGHPGTGKSFTARALAGALGLPIFVLRLDAIIGSYLGQTGSRLNEVFRFAEHHACVLFLDEIDALARQRGRSLDVGELDRIVIGLMQALDYARIRGLVVAATNFATGLDSALWRRFELELHLPRPNRTGLLRYLRRRLSELELSGSPSALARELPRTATYADAERCVLMLHRRWVLDRLEETDG